MVSFSAINKNMGVLYMYLADSLFSAASLAMDAFAVALCVGAGAVAANRGAAFRLSFACGSFQFLMPILGWFLGVYAISFIAAFDHWVAFGLLAMVGGNMILGSLSSESKSCSTDTTRGRALICLALATSIDALAVGTSFSIASRPIAPLAVGAGIITAVLCYAGVIFGRFAGNKIGKRVEFVGGVVLALIGLNILREHLFLLG